MARAARIYDFTILPGGSFTLLVEGSYYRLLSSTGAIEVRREDGSVVGPLMAGQGEQNQEFKRLTLVDKSGSNNIGTIVVADNTFVDARTTGEVSVIDGELSRSKSGNAFATSFGLGAVGGQYAIIEIWNPAGSGKRCIVSDLQFSSSTAAAYALVRTSALVVAPSGALSKSNIGAVSQTKCNGYNSATVPIGPNLEQILVAASISVGRIFKQPYIIEPNSGLAVYNSAIGLNMYASVQFTEEPA